jgi:high-affinity iron transporter
MFEALVITLREGVEAALVLSIALAVLRRQGLGRLAPALFLGAGTAIAAAGVAGVLLSRIPFNQELTGGVAMIVGSALVFGLVVWMWRTGPNMKREIEHGLGRATQARGAITGGGTGAWGVFLIAFGMVFREGLETVLFLLAAGFNSDALQLWLGAAIGLAVAIGFGVLFVRGTVRIPLKPFFSLTSAVLLLIAVQLLVGGLHELSEAQVLPASRAEMALIGPVVKNELLLFAMTVALAAGWLLFGARREPAPVAAATEGPEARLQRAARARERSWRRWTGVTGLLVVAFLSTAFAKQSRVPRKAPAEPAPATDGVVRIDPSPARDGHMHFYETITADGPVRFFAIQVNGQLQTCADACQICGDLGYFESGGAVVCRNCTSPIAVATLGRKGGCNPIPLPHRLEHGQLVVAESDLRALVPHLKGR